MTLSYRENKYGSTEEIAKVISDFLISRRSDYKDIVTFKIVYSRFKGEYIPIMAKVEFFYKDQNQLDEAVCYDYGEAILVCHRITIDRFLTMLGSISSKIITLPEEKQLVLTENANLTLLNSKSNYGYGGHDWPAYVADFPLSRPSHIDANYQILAKEGFPTFPDVYTATTDFLKLPSKLEHHSSLCQLVVVIPDFRARIVKVVLSGKKVTLDIESRTLAKDKVIAKMYLAKGRQSYQSGDLRFDLSNTVTCQSGFEPDMIVLCILEREHNEVLDIREVRLDYLYYASDVFVESPSAEIMGLINRGENESVEFKREPGNDFLETFVAFANANGGMILLGVENNGQIAGYNKVEDLDALRDSITCKILSNIQPSTIKFKLHKVEFDSGTLDGGSKSVIVITVLKGENRPYYLRDKGIIMRHGATDGWITPTELEEIYAAKHSHDPRPSVVWR